MNRKEILSKQQYQQCGEKKKYSYKHLLLLNLLRIQMNTQENAIEQKIIIISSAHTTLKCGKIIWQKYNKKQQIKAECLQTL